ncbi:MAG: STAS/SEC14 domain-containing protein [Thermoanaerobaculia bacterium]
MATSSQAMSLSPEQLLDAVDQLDPADLKPFVSRIVARAAQRVAPSLSESETPLLQKINRGFSPASDQRCRELVSKRRAETLSSEEHAELLELMDEVEKWQAERVRHLIDLAAIRGNSLSELMDELGIEAPPIE